jgi:hypothetical protein
VFALDHLDETCCYTTKRGSPFKFDRNVYIYDFKKKKEHIFIREQETRALIDEIEN